MTKQATELRYAVRFRVVFKYFGPLCLVLAALTMVPLMMSLIFGEMTISLRHGLSNLESRVNVFPQYMEVPPNMEASLIVSPSILFLPLNQTLRYQA
jgi:hypothetical protein